MIAHKCGVIAPKCVLIAPKCWFLSPRPAKKKKVTLQMGGSHKNWEYFRIFEQTPPKNK
jgi:hypothetical protein